MNLITNNNIIMNNPNGTKELLKRKNILITQLINWHYTSSSEYKELKEFIKYLNFNFKNYKNHE